MMNLDESCREALAVDVVPSLSTALVTQVLEQLVALHRAPRTLRCHNGPWFVSFEPAAWCLPRRAAAAYPIPEAKPESLHRTLPRELTQSSPRLILLPYGDQALAHSLQHAAALRQSRPGPAAHLPGEVNCPVPVQLQMVCRLEKVPLQF